MRKPSHAKDKTSQTVLRVYAYVTEPKKSQPYERYLFVSAENSARRAGRTWCTPCSPVSRPTCYSGLRKIKVYGSNFNSYVVSTERRTKTVLLEVSSNGTAIHAHHGEISDKRDRQWPIFRRSLRVHFLEAHDS